MDNRRYLRPLFWVHGENEDFIRNEIQIMDENGCDSFIVEPRPHPEYLKADWWRDIGIIIDEAKKRNMGVWLFDDGAYPSGCANGEIVNANPGYLKKFIRNVYIDACGPLMGSSFLINSWLAKGEEVLAVVAAKRIEVSDQLDSDTLIDITKYISGGRLYWEIPTGEWRVFIFIRSLTCAEDHTRNHINPLEKDAVKAFIDYTYEQNYKQFKAEFGKTIKGFFTDEPRFGNYPSYHAVLGTKDMPIPYADGLLDVLEKEAGFEYTKYLPLLWYQGGEMTAEIRYTYMNVVSRLFAENFTGQASEWCNKHGVKLIGHVVEENGAHARVGYGAGHFFRSTKGLDHGGLDIVYNILPGYTSGDYNSPFFKVDVDFNHWGIAKMASSSAHIDPKKNGITMCEAFGAYGWQEGLKLMKWITDHLAVRGVNRIVPHAFTLGEFPDQDCPPHFYAGGNNPQFKDFFRWADYANRVCDLITGGIHQASAAVLYHAEAEWGGSYQPFEKVVKELAMGHIDCDVVPIDCLLDQRVTAVEAGKLRIHNEKYHALVIPYSRYLPEEFRVVLQDYLKQGLPVVFLEAYPHRSYFQDSFNLRGAEICHTTELPKWFTDRDFFDIKVAGNGDSLRFYHYSKAGKEIYFFVNESKFTTVDVVVDLNETMLPVLYDPMNDKSYQPDFNKDGLHIYLEPFESIFVICVPEINADLPRREMMNTYKERMILKKQWKIGLSTAETYPEFETTEVKTLVNLSKPELYPEFSGMIRYETTFDLVGKSTRSCYINLGLAFETVNVWINGKKAAGIICPPYAFPVEMGILRETGNELVIEVTNTLAKRLGENLFDQYLPQEPTGLIGPVELLFK